MMPKPDTLTKTKVVTKEVTEKIPLYDVILLNDETHTYEYVLEMLNAIFGYDEQKSLDLAIDVDSKGRAVVQTTFKERAEFKRDQIKKYGPDWRLPHSDGSMNAIIESNSKNS